MTADEMFRQLGYLKTKDNEDLIEYQRPKNYGFEVISIRIKKNLVFKEEIDYYGDIFLVALTSEEDKAVEKIAEEMERVNEQIY